MALEIAGVTMDQLLSIETSERSRFARHAVPGMNGELSQDLGRPSVQIRVRGIFYGADAAGRLQTLRGHLLARTPVDFLCDVTHEGYFAQVLVERLEVAQRAGQPGEFDYECELLEYVPPPPPPAASALGALDASILDEAASLMDDVQNAIAAVAGLGELLSGAAEFGNPTTRLPSMLESFAGAAGGGAASVGEIGKLL